MNTEKLTTPIGDFEFVLDGYPTRETAQKLFDALDFQRACQAYIDFMPAMSMYSLLEGQEKGWGCKECSDLAVAADLLRSTPLVLTGSSVEFMQKRLAGKDWAEQAIIDGTSKPPQLVKLD
jgi:hypothetical protein